MKPTVLDASSILHLFHRQPKKIVDVLGDGFVLFLTGYEIGNALRTEANLRRTTSPERAEVALRGMTRLLGEVTTLYLDPADSVEILRLAERRSLSFYDAAYLHAALKRGLTLMTEDAGLAREAKKEGVEVVLANSI